MKDPKNVRRMSFEITGVIAELDNLNKEIARLNKLLTGYRKRKRELDSVLAKFLEAQKQDGFKVQKMKVAVIAEEKARLVQKPKDEREKEAVDILRSSGVQNASDVYKKILQSQKQSNSVKQIHIKPL